MANSKARCGGCKKYFPQSEMKLFGATRFCSIDCAVKKASTKSNIDKGKKIARSIQRQRKESLKDKRWYIKECQKWFNKFIRLRDAGLPCISCGKPQTAYNSLKGHMFDAGHYRSVGSSPEHRFNENNCHAQCVKCNRELSGNCVSYRLGLIKKIGLSQVEALEMDNQPKNYIITDIKEMIQFYKQKCKELQNDR